MHKKWSHVNINAAGYFRHVYRQRLFMATEMKSILLMRFESQVSEPSPRRRVSLGAAETFSIKQVNSQPASPRK